MKYLQELSKLESKGESWNFTLYGKNLTDEEYCFTGFSSFEAAYAADPRQIMLTSRYHMR